MSRNCVLTMACAGALGSALAGTSLAQDQPVSQTLMLEEIVVSAQRRSEDLQDVPVAVTAFTSEQRILLGVESAQEIANRSPGLVLGSSLSIRGIGRFNQSLGTDPGVAVYHDGFYLADPGAISQSTLITERTEVLRGPQGTLFGRNSIGGAVNIITRRPTADFQGEVRLAGSNYERGDYALSYSGPISDAVRFRVAATRSVSGKGYIKNLAGDDLGDVDNLYAEAQLEVDLTANLQWWVKYSRFEYDNRPTYTIQVDQPDMNSPSNTIFPPFSLVSSALYQYQRPEIGQERTVSLDFSGHTELDDNHVALTHLTWDLGAVTAKYVGGWSTSSVTTEYDYDSTSRGSIQYTIGNDTREIPTFYTALAQTDSEYSSHEITLASNAETGVQWVGGLYYYKDNVDSPFYLRSPTNARFDTSLVPPTYAPTTDNPLRAFYFQRGELTSESYAAFGQATIPLSSTWNFTLGTRYSEDKKTGEEELHYWAWNPFATTDPLGNGTSWSNFTYPPASQSCCAISITPNPSRRVPPLSDKWSGFSGRVAVDWKPTDTSMYYASVSRGYKSGGYQLGQVAADPVVNEETVTAYEIGTKLSLSSSVRMNAAAFFYDYQNLQIPVSVIRDGVQNSVYDNIPEAETYGAEIETIWAPSDNLQLMLSYGYLNATFGQYSGVFDIFAVTPTNPRPQTDLSGGFVPQSPEHKGNFTALYAIAFAAGTLNLVGSYSYVGEQYFSIFNVDKLKGDDYAITDFRAVWESPSSSYTLIAFLRNAFDEYYATTASVGPATVGSPRGISAGAPRTYGMELQVRF